MNVAPWTTNAMLKVATVKTPRDRMRVNVKLDFLDSWRGWPVQMSMNASQETTIAMEARNARTLKARSNVNVKKASLVLIWDVSMTMNALTGVILVIPTRFVWTLRDHSSVSVWMDSVVLAWTVTTLMSVHLVYMTATRIQPVLISSDHLSVLVKAGLSFSALLTVTLCAEMLTNVSQALTIVIPMLPV